MSGCEFCDKHHGYLAHTLSASNGLPTDVRWILSLRVFPALWTLLTTSHMNCHWTNIALSFQSVMDGIQYEKTPGTASR